MKRIFKGLIIIAGLIVLAVGVALGYFALNRDKIHDAIKTSIHEKLQAKVEFDKTEFTFFRDFPNITIELKNILIADSLYDLYKKPIISSKGIYLETNLWKLLILKVDVKKVFIDDASINIFTDTNGYSNSYILKNLSKKEHKTDVEERKKSNVDFDLSEVRLNNVAVSIRDEVDTKAFGFKFEKVKLALKRSGDAIDADVDGNIFMEGLTFKQRKGTFLKDQPIYLKTHLKLNNEKVLFDILPSQLEIGKAKFDLSGYIKTGKEGELQLLLHNDAVTLLDCEHILTPRIYSKLKQFGFDGSLAADVSIKAPLKGGGDPYVDVKAIANDNTIYIKDVQIDSTYFNGSFTNHASDSIEPGDSNSRLDFVNFRSKLSGLHLKGTVAVIDFDDTKAKLDLAGHARLDELQNMMNVNSIQLKGGEFKTDLHFYGNVKTLYDSIAKKVNGEATGNIEITGGALTYVPKKMEINNLNVLINIKSGRTNTINISAKSPGSDLAFNGELEQVIPFLLSSENTLRIRASIKSDAFNFGPLLANSAPQAKPQQKPQKKVEQNVSAAIDRIISNTEITATLDAKHAYFHKFSADNVTGKLLIGHDNASITDFSFDHAKGKIKYAASLNKNKTGFAIKFNASVKSVSMPVFMESFENFNQKSLTGKNIKGTISLDVNATFNANPDFNIIPGSMFGKLNATIVDGELNNFEPLENISKYVFKNRNLDSVKFSSINCAAELKGNEVYIEQMVILSSALAVGVEGIYSFGDKTDLSIQVPLKNLQAKSPEYFSNVESFKKYKGANIFLRGKTDNGKLKFSYDPTKKFRKKKK